MELTKIYSDWGAMKKNTWKDLDDKDEGEIR